MCASKITQASAPRSSSAIQSTIVWPPISSSPSQRDADVDGQVALGGEQRRRLQEQVELALVVGDPARVQPLVADRRLERAGSPIRRAARAAGRRSARRRARSEPTSASREARSSPIASGRPSTVDELALAAGRADEVADPLAGAPDVGLVRGVGADARNTEELRELLEPGRVEARARNTANLSRAPPARRLRARDRRRSRAPPAPRAPALRCLRHSTARAEVSAGREHRRRSAAWPPTLGPQGDRHGRAGSPERSGTARERLRRLRGASASRPARAASSGSGSRSGGSARA